MADVDKALALLESSPDQYTKALDLLLKGWTPDAVNKHTSLSLATIKSMQARHPEIAAGQREFIMGNIKEAQARLIARINETADKMPPKDAALAFGILVDKGQLLQGEATQRVERVAQVSQEDIIKRIEKLKKARVREIESKNVEVREIAQKNVEDV